MKPNTGNAKIAEWGPVRYGVVAPDGEMWFRAVYQDKPVREVGNNGICMLDILDSMIDRLSQFQQTWPCQENEDAIGHMREAAFALIKKRDRRRKEATCL